MIYKNKLIAATLIKRYKRFLADVVLEDGQTSTVYCPNTGSMRGCAVPGSRVYLSRSGNIKRKYPLTLEMIRVEKTWVGVNTGLTNRIVVEALQRGDIAEISEIETIQREVTVSPGSRLDVLVVSGGRKIFIEIKNCTLVEKRVAMFPDAVTARGTRHLLELARLCEQGHEGVIFFLVQRGDAEIFRPAAHIDPLYAEVLRQVCESGVKILVYQAQVEPRGISVLKSLPSDLS
ncbi:DNA/RNA nuclease SfsA [Desulfopila inferna]|uniref:DNA/RNA nuclease SfsA n=1 Tax=Desulfopila inferna TaxID=468528 RepID=UPI0019658FF3|nr:DNA/RNA nuclease SfsA [Desulfopila inferna]MBM9606226.1 DNA/RNA nuclease SfsA [Desulfopila inferna]